MAHTAQRTFFSLVKDTYPQFFTGQRVLEVGSLDINGTCRDFFDNCMYVGVDVGPGPGVDIVCPGQDLTFPDESFDVMVSGECFEHNPAWRETFVNMVRMLRPDGLIAFTCAGEGRPEHGTSRTDTGSSPLTISLGQEYYHNLTPKDFDAKDLEGLDYQFYENHVNLDLYFMGIKGRGLRKVDWETIEWAD